MKEGGPRQRVGRKCFPSRGGDLEKGGMRNPGDAEVLPLHEAVSGIAQPGPQGPPSLG